ncbi:carbon-nitrogen hydrolase [Ceraceosorus guamensis]|uniref:Carbon-nitrogen hydrolase n=1 Tax=Ceraceosorus guamensis TaxID=1522189 RepID=A0A316W075_9BASI|nr:carbon-nitrogen hydrolase [Ceraceosorus guamensis]PWN43246.1 carbon-nitrogen hydrolase [Ceraceosorus guamensis]
MSGAGSTTAAGVSASAPIPDDASHNIRLAGSFGIHRPSTLSASPRSELRIALAQVTPSSSDNAEAEGLAIVRAYAKRAAHQGADVLVLPEYFLSGATHDQWRAVAERGEPKGGVQDAHLREDHFLSEIASIAKEFDLDIVSGTAVEAGPHVSQSQERTKHHAPHRGEKDATQARAEAPDQIDVFNTAYYVGRDGQLIDLECAPQNLWHPERSVLTSATASSHPAPRTFDIITKAGRSLKVGMLICWDLGFPEAFRELYEPNADVRGGPMVGPDVVFVPTCWYATDAGAKGLRWNKDGESALLDSLVLARAIENECVVAMCNVSGASWPSGEDLRRPLDDASKADRSFGDEQEEPIGVGRSQVCAPFLGRVAVVNDEKEVLLLAALDLRVLDDARDVYKIREDLGKATVAH